MSRKNPSLAELLVLAPWWVSVSLGVVAYVGLRWVIPALTATESNPVLKAAMGSVSAFAPLALIFCAALAILSAVFARKRRRLVDSQTSLETLKSIHWQEFEWLVGEAFRRQGYAVEEGLSRGADGGIDVVLRKDGAKTLVQCKHRKSSAVNVSVVRELFGVMTADRAQSAIVITTATFTRDAREFATNKPLRLIDGEALLSLVKDVQQTAPIQVQRPVAQPISKPLSTTAQVPLCPKCSAAMVLRTAKRGANAGNSFWGCSTYPKCTGVRSAA